MYYNNVKRGVQNENYYLLSAESIRKKTHNKRRAQSV